jgi:hypothetical protein
VQHRWRLSEHTIVTAIARVIERVPICTVISAWRCGSLAHLLLVVGLEVCWIHRDAVTQGDAVSRDQLFDGDVGSV